jgi:hypothetical protein
MRFKNACWYSHIWILPMLDSNINCYSLCYQLLKPKISWALSKLMIDHGYMENFMQSGRALGQGGTAVGMTALAPNTKGPWYVLSTILGWLIKIGTPPGLGCWEGGERQTDTMCGHNSRRDSRDGYVRIINWKKIQIWRERLHRLERSKVVS